jgi:hypothetical protein
MEVLVCTLQSWASAALPFFQWTSLGGRSEVLWTSLIAGKSYGSSPARADLRSSFRDFVIRIFAINIIHAHRYGLTFEVFWENHPAYRHLSEVE